MKSSYKKLQKKLVINMQFEKPKCCWAIIFFINAKKIIYFYQLSIGWSVFVLHFSTNFAQLFVNQLVSLKKNLAKNYNVLLFSTGKFFSFSKLNLKLFSNKLLIHLMTTYTFSVVLCQKITQLNFQNIVFVAIFSVQTRTI